MLTPNSDIIDHEPSDGDVYKMLAGSVDPEMDDKSTRPNRRVPTSHVLHSPDATPRTVPRTTSPRPASGLMNRLTQRTESSRSLNTPSTSEYRPRIPSISLTPN